MYHPSHARPEDGNDLLTASCQQQGKMKSQNRERRHIRRAATGQ
jgi:hypothetical protein